MAQTDEEDIGITYAELDTLNKLRMFKRQGPVGMFFYLLEEWGDMMDI